MSKSKSKYSKEFKDATLQLILNNNESVVKVAMDLNLKTFYSWVTMYKKALNIPTKDITCSSYKESLDVENKQLKRELKIVKDKRDILKKTTAYFAKETL